MKCLYIKRLLTTVFKLTLETFFVANLNAQDFVYTNNNVQGANTVSAFSVAPNGVLTQIAGSPFATGGEGTGGGFVASNRITVCVAGNFLYVTNDGSNNVSGFSIDPATGSLTPVPSSPFPTGGVSVIGISLAVTPDGQFLMAGNAYSQNITVYSIAPNGALAPIVGSPFPAGGPPDGMRVTPDGKYLSVALPYLLGGSVSIFNIAPNGSLTSVPGSPFPDGGTGTAAGVDVNCGSNLLFAGEANTSGKTIVDVFSIASNGALTPIAGSPFISNVGRNSNVVLLSPDNQHLFVSNQNSGSITVFDVAPNGSLTLVPGSPFPVGGGTSPSGMATNSTGSLLFIAIHPLYVGVFRVGSDGVLTPILGSPFSIGNQPWSGLMSLAYFPPKTCVIKVDLDIKPQSCPNPVNIKSKGAIPVAILGNADLNVNDIDISSILLEGVAPIRSDIEDVSAPVVNRQDVSDCTIDGADGFADLALKFDKQAIVAALGSVNDGNEVVLTIAGRLFDGTAIEGKDCVIIKSKGKGLGKTIAESEGSVPESYALFQNYPNPFNPETEIRFQLPEASHVIVRILNTLGQEIRMLADTQYKAGYHSIRWDGRDNNGVDVSSGIYFYQLQADSFSKVKKMSLLR